MKIKRLSIDYTRFRAALPFGTVLNHYQIDHPGDREQFKVRCPFHEDREPSLSINTLKGVFQCFGCAAKGNTFEFVAAMEGLDLAVSANVFETAKRAAALAGLDLQDYQRERPTPRGPKSPETGQKSRKRLESRVDPQTAASDDSVPSHEPPTPRRNPPLDLELSLDPEHPFLKARGITAAVAREFGLGYCARGLMKQRIAIPIHDEDGVLVAYAGRWADDDIPKDTERYRLPKGFEKSLVLFNLHRAKAFGKRHVVLVEGYWSVFRLHQAGIPAASPLGHTVSKEQAALLPAAGFRYVTLLFDGDEAGRQGALAALPMLAPHLYVRILELPEGEKPDTMPEAWFDHLR